ncbi:hypothetical protein CoNPh26_CDS0052 [Staphylococcus phage S-CoN_Ph26]|nr:hypothetical protein CoNPh26_CDS0052 [Staphylococcus phage S-CoN_Ph26]
MNKFSYSHGVVLYMLYVVTERKYLSAFLSVILNGSTTLTSASTS